MVGLSKSEEHTIEVVSICANGVSLLGSIFILYNFFSFKELRNLAGKLVFMVGCTDLITEFACLFGSPKEGSTACIAQAVILQFGSISSILWVGVICFVIYDVVIKCKVNAKDTTLTYHYAFVWGLSLVLTILPATTKSYGKSIGWCWVDENKHIDNLWRYVTWYAILCGTILYSFYMYFMTRNVIGRNPVVSRMFWYPVAMFVCFVPGLIFRIQKSTGEPEFILGIVHAFCRGIYGIINALIFAKSNHVQAIWKELCCKIPRTDFTIRRSSLSLESFAEETPEVTEDAVLPIEGMEMSRFSTTGRPSVNQPVDDWAGSEIQIDSPTMDLQVNYLVNNSTVNVFRKTSSAGVS